MTDPIVERTERLIEEEQELNEELQEIAAAARTIRPIPLFEWFVTMFSIAMSVVLFLDPTVLMQSGETPIETYDIMLQMAPPHLWAFAFLLAGLTKSVGLLVHSIPLRILGLVMSVLIYLSLSITFIVHYPNIGAVMGTLTAIFSGIAITAIKPTQ